MVSQTRMEQQASKPEERVNNDVEDNGKYRIEKAYYITSKKKIRKKTFTKEKILSILKNHGNLDVSSLKQSEDVFLRSINYEQFTPLSGGAVFIRRVNDKLEFLTKNGMLFQLLNIDVYQDQTKKLPESKQFYHKMILRTYPLFNKEGGATEHMLNIVYPRAYTAAYFSSKDRINTAFKTLDGSIVQLKQNSKNLYEFLVYGRAVNFPKLRFVAYGKGKSMIDVEMTTQDINGQKFVTLKSPSVKWTPLSRPKIALYK